MSNFTTLVLAILFIGAAVVIVEYKQKSIVQEKVFVPPVPPIPDSVAESPKSD